MQEKPTDLESLKTADIMAVCRIQHRLIAVLIFEIERLMNAASGADAESNEVIQEWVNGVSKRIGGAGAEIQKIIDADTAPKTKQ